MDNETPTSADIEMTRSAISGAKLRAGHKLTINTTTMKTRAWPTIEIWVKKKRRYLPLSVGDVWRYETEAARDAVLAKLQPVSE